MGKKGAFSVSQFVRHEGHAVDPENSYSVWSPEMHPLQTPAVSAVAPNCHWPHVLFWLPLASSRSCQQQKASVPWLYPEGRQMKCVMERARGHSDHRTVVMFPLLWPTTLSPIYHSSHGGANDANATTWLAASGGSQLLLMLHFAWHLSPKQAHLLEASLL